MVDATDKTNPQPQPPDRRRRSRSRRIGRRVGGALAIVLAMILYVNYCEGRQREVDKLLYLAVYGEDPIEVERLLVQGANPNSRLNDRAPSWVQRAVGLMQGRDVWTRPMGGGGLLTMSDQRMPRINTFLNLSKKRTPSSADVEKATAAQVAAARRRMDRLNRIHDLLIKAGARP